MMEQHHPDLFSCETAVRRLTRALDRAYQEIVDGHARVECEVAQAVGCVDGCNVVEGQQYRQGTCARCQIYARCKLGYDVEFGVLTRGEDWIAIEHLAETRRGR